MAIDRKFRIPRLWSNQELRRIAPLFSGSVVNVSGWKDEDKEGGHYREYFSGASTYMITNYGGYRGFQGSDEDEILLDLEKDLPSELTSSFDVVFNHTTLEHIFKVNTAFKNLCDMSKDIVIVVVPFAQTQHEQDGLLDFWRFTPTALRYMCKENGLSIIYEAANSHRNAGIYVIVVASKNPKLWLNKMPTYKPLEEIAWSLGTTWKQRLTLAIKRYVGLAK